MGSTYGQFCPVAKAMELLDERWTLLVVRELLMGSRHFNELRRGVPRMSPALLSKRLRELTRAGVVERLEHGNRMVYVLTPAGKELLPVVDALGRWGTRWIGELGETDLDPHLLLWDMHRNLNLDAMPGGQVVLKFTFTDVPAAERDWWLVITNNEVVDVCVTDPGYPVSVTTETGLHTLVRIWRGDVTWQDALRAGDLRLEGPTRLCRALPHWLKLSYFAAVPRVEAVHA